MEMKKNIAFIKMTDAFNITRTRENMLLRNLAAARKMGEAEVAEWGITPGRVTSLVQALLRVAEEWGEEAKHFR